MTSQGTPHGRFQRAIQRGHLFHAELAARELGALTLADALALTVLIGKEQPARYGRAAVRWHGRFELEARGLELPESQLALAALAALPQDPHAAVSVLARIADRHGVRWAQVAPSDLAISTARTDPISVSRDPARRWRGVDSVDVHDVRPRGGPASGLKIASRRGKIFALRSKGKEVAVTRLVLTASLLALIMLVAPGAPLADPGGPNLQQPVSLTCTGGLHVDVNPGTLTNRGRVAWAIDSTSVFVTAYLAFTNGTDTFVAFDSKPGLNNLITCTGDAGGGLTVIATGFFTPR